MIKNDLEKEKWIDVHEFILEKMSESLRTGEIELVAKYQSLYRGARELSQEAIPSGSSEGDRLFETYLHVHNGFKYHRGDSIPQYC